MSTRAASQRSRHSSVAREPQRVSRQPQFTPISSAIMRCGSLEATGSIARYAGRLSARFAPSAAVAMGQNRQQTHRDHDRRDRRPPTDREVLGVEAPELMQGEQVGEVGHR
jgi:hypothetical protein